MRGSYTLSIFVTLTFHPLPVLLPFLFPNALHRELFQSADDYGIRDSILCVGVLFLLTCTCGVNSHTSSLALLQGGFGCRNESTPALHLWIKTLEG